jgi:hypothetical protein
VKGKAIPLAILLVSVALLAAAVPVFGQPPHAIAISGLMCGYVIDPGEEEITQHWRRVRGQVMDNQFYSDDPAVFPDSTGTGVLDWMMNFHGGIVVWQGTGVFDPDGVAGTYEATWAGWIKFDPVTFERLEVKGQMVFHGTGELEGQTAKLDIHPGDPTQCPPDGYLFTADVWAGFIVPPGD